MEKDNLVILIECGSFRHSALKKIARMVVVIPKHLFFYLHWNQHVVAKMAETWGHLYWEVESYSDEQRILPARQEEFSANRQHTSFLLLFTKRPELRCACKKKTIFDKLEFCLSQVDEIYFFITKLKNKL